MKRVVVIEDQTAVRDMLEILVKRWPVADVVVKPSRVQGDGAAEDQRQLPTPNAQLPRRAARSTG